MFYLVMALIFAIGGTLSVSQEMYAMAASHWAVAFFILFTGIFSELRAIKDQLKRQS